MIDVMLVLLIIFMIVTPLVAAGFQATLPVAANTFDSKEEDDEIILGMDVTGSYFLDGLPVAKDQIEARLQALYANRETDKLIYFKAHSGLKYAQVQEAVEMARRSGARVLVAIMDKRGGPAGEEEQ
ncbi:MAG: biopolymer transporter ExbD [Gemmatimonadales bacterium]|nr:biopolymer transporter ExbD [Gemmatimonadales bacterium]